MIANYHTHTPRCGHAVGSEEQYIRSALERGLKILGFSDHSPYTFPNGYYSNFRMPLNQLEDYARTILRLKAEYREQLELHLGVELEYYPAYLPDLMPMLQDCGVEYAILGQHFLGNEINDCYSGEPTEDVSVLERYCNQVTEAMDTGWFTYLAHPDLLRFTGDKKVYRSKIRNLCRRARELQIPLEVNFWGFAGGRHYPNPDFWEVAAEENCQAVLGCDAHEPEFLKDVELERQVLDFLRPYELEILETVPLRPLK